MKFMVSSRYRYITFLHITSARIKNYIFHQFIYKTVQNVRFGGYSEHNYIFFNENLSSLLI